MAVPTEIDWLLVKMGDGATPTEVFTLVCGIQDVTINQTVNVTDRAVRDCATPGAVPTRKTRATSKQLDISGSGLSNSASIVTLNAALGALKNYKIEAYQDAGTDTGTLLGTFAGNFRMTSSNLSVPREGDGGGDIALASQGAWTWTAA